MEERQLIEGCIRGDAQARKMLYEQHAPAMMSVCLRYTGSRETARDLLHDGFVKLFTVIRSYSGTGSFNGWMRKIFVTTALEHLRRKDVLRYGIDIETVDFRMEESNTSIFEQLSADDLLACIADLPDGFRTVFNMHAIEGYSHAEIAEELGIKESTSRSQYARAKLLLQKAIITKMKDIPDVDHKQTIKLKTG